MNKAKEGQSTIASGVLEKKTLKLKLAQKEKTIKLKLAQKKKVTPISSRSLKLLKLRRILTQKHFLDCVLSIESLK